MVKFAAAHYSGTYCTKLGGLTLHNNGFDHLLKLTTHAYSFSYWAMPMSGPKKGGGMCLKCPPPPTLTCQPLEICHMVSEIFYKVVLTTLTEELLATLYHTMSSLARARLF